MTLTLRLPTPHYCTVADGTVAIVGDVDDRLPSGHVPDPQLHPRTFSVTWQNTPGAVADAIRRAYEGNPYDVFSIVLPNFGAVLVTWNSPPTIQWSTWSSAATVTAELDEATAHD